MGQGDNDEGEDELIPARMVNELVYRPRLYWLETVAAAFDDNRHTLLGQHAHRRVDQPGGTALKADDGGADVLERGTWLSSSALGVSAKLDRVVADPEHDGAVLPVDTKKGRMPTSGLWPADEVQAALQGMLLRDAGHTVARVGVYSVAEQRRVVVDLTDELVARAQAAVVEARRVRTLPLAPPPLVDSPKCLGCSLVHICQPDEVNQLEGRTDNDNDGEAPTLRTVLPPSGEQRAVVVSSSTARVNVDGEELVMTDKEVDDDGEEREVVGRLGFGRIASLAIYGRAMVSTPALHALARAGIPVALHQSSGYFLGALTPALVTHQLSREDSALRPSEASDDGGSGCERSKTREMPGVASLL